MNPSNNDHHNHTQGNIKIAFFLNLAFTLIEIIGGLLTNSMAILSDALHDLGDSLSLGFAWFLENYSKKKADHKFSYGYARFSILGALINSLVLFGGSLLILSKAIPRIFNPEAVHPQGMFVLAIFGIIINGVAVLKLKKGSSLNEKVVSWHLLEDVFGWIAILLTSIVLMFVDLPIIDPLLSIALTLYVLFNIIKNLKGVLNIMLEGVPEPYAIDDIEAIILDLAGIKSVHHTHIWSLSGEKIFLSTHVVIDKDTDYKSITQYKKKIRQVLMDENIEHATIEVDFEEKTCHDKNCL
jgi:cobalt-zinc-cadmium efflux system protein